MQSEKGSDIHSPIEVKITGDDAPVSHVSSVILLSSFFLPTIQDSLSSNT